jgi:hypothetical protein
MDPDPEGQKTYGSGSATPYGTEPPFARTHWPLLLRFCDRDPLLRQFWANFWQKLSQQVVSRQLLLGAAVT